MTSDPTALRWRQLTRVTGMAGLASFVLTLGPIIAASGQEPGFDGSAEAVQAYFRSTSSAVAAFGSFVVVVGLLAMVWFAVGLALLLARAEGPPPWRSAVLAASASIFAIVNLNGYWEAASYRADGLTPELALFAFDVGNLAFANSWVAMGSFALCGGWVMLSTRFTPRWVGWLAVAAGAGLVLCRAVWTSEIWFLPYALFWIWVVTVAVRLLRQRSSSPELGLPVRSESAATSRRFDPA